jgi:putative ABC transport system ATP-binding protein
MLGALLRPTSGEVRLNGDVISALKENRLPGIRLRKFGFVFQDFNLLSALTALENVSIVAELAGVRGKEARQKAARLLIDLGLGERLNFLPEKLSGGKRRVAVRALSTTGADLADRPTANLDSKGGRGSCACYALAKEQNARGDRLSRPADQGHCGSGALVGRRPVQGGFDDGN